MDARVKDVRFARVAFALAAMPLLGLPASLAYFAMPMALWVVVLDATGAIMMVTYTVLLVVLVLHLARIVPDDAAARIFVRCVVGASIALVPARLLWLFDLMHAAALDVVVWAAVIAEMAWLIWVNYWLLRRTDFPRRHGRLGQFAGACACIGVTLGGVVFLLPPTSSLHVVLDGAGTTLLVLSGFASIVWFIYCGRWLRPARPAEAFLLPRRGVLK